MIANNACPNGLLMSPHTYEGHSLFDVIYNDITDLEADGISGDTHSINQVNFALMHLIGCEFMPHIKNIRDQVEKIGAFENSETNAADLIVPKHRYDEALIRAEWPDIQHILASLLMKQTTQHVIVRKLSSHPHQRLNKTLKALWEYNKILHDQHILNVIDSPDLRRATRTVLNRGEGYHQLTGKIMSVNGNKLRGSAERELAISGECIRLIANCIIFYNMYLLSELYTRYEKTGDEAILKVIKKISPIAWRHINMGGRYEFATFVEALNIMEILKNVILSTTG
jgi:TnpA family transposase